MTITVTLRKDTQLCISVAARPGELGTLLHNACYRALDLDFVYKAFGISDIAGAMAGVRALGIRGCSVSMPFKETVRAHLDALDPAAARIGAVNTVVNDQGTLTGYNTDVAGARAALDRLEVTPEDRVLVLGAGGMARAILLALRERGVASARVVARRAEQVSSLQSLLPCTFVAWEHRLGEASDVLINATSVGMAPDAERLPIDDIMLDHARAVFDVVASPMETALIRAALRQGKRVVPGYVLSLHQAAAQFKLYTGVDAPMDRLDAELRRALNRPAAS